MGKDGDTETERVKDREGTERGQIQKQKAIEREREGANKRYGHTERDTRDRERDTRDR